MIPRRRANGSVFAAAARAILCCCALFLGAAAPRAHALDGTWSFLPPGGRTPTGRYQYSLTLYGGNPVIYGGTSGNLRSGSELGDMWMYDLGLAVWQELISVTGVYPSARWGASLTAYGTDLFLFGGSNTPTYLNDLWRYSMTENKWDQIPFDLTAAKPMPRQAFGTVIRPSEPDRLYILSGIGMYASLRDMWTLSLTPPHVFTEVVFNNSLFTGDSNGSPQWTGGKGCVIKYRPDTDTIISAFGTPQLSGEDINVNYVSEYNFTAREWRRVTTTFSASTDGESAPPRRNLAASSLVDDQLIVLGGWNDIDQIDEHGTFILDLVTKDWRLLPTGEHEPDARDSALMIPLPAVPAEVLELNPAASSVLFSFGGWGDTGITNDIFYLETTNMTWYNTHPFVTTPSPRSAMASAVHGNTVVMFGGVDATGLIYADLWILNADDGSWRQVSPPGDQPAGRHSHGGCMLGDEFYIFGGVGASGLMSDTWHYSFVQGIWIPVVYTFDAVNPVNAPQSRRNMGLTSSSLFLYVIAGKGSVDLYNDVNELDTVTGRWRLVSANVRADPAINNGEAPTDYPVPRYQFGFSVLLYPRTANDSSLLYDRNVTAPIVDIAFVVFGGLDAASTELNDAWLFRLSNESWSAQYPTTLKARSLTGAVTQGSHKYISIGGQIYEDMIDEVRLFQFDAGIRDQSSKESFNLSTSIIPVSPLTADGRTPPPLASHSAVMIQDRIILFGGFSSLPPAISSTTTLVPALTSNQVYGFQLSPLCPIGLTEDTNLGEIQIEAGDCFMCSPGSHAVRNEMGNVSCSYCPSGRYANHFGATECTACSAGFYSGLIGAASGVSCVACDAGTYNNQTGASACLKCPENANCPAATITPTFGQLSSIPINRQPQPLASLTAKKLEQQSSVLFGALGNIGLAVLVICVIVKVQREDSLKAFDLYPREHRPLCQEHRIMKEWKTSLGGIFSICGIIFVLYFIVIQSLDWLDAVRETRSLIPNLSAPVGLETKAEISVALAFQNYGDNCVDSNFPVDANGRFKCQAAISARSSNLFVTSTELRCTAGVSAGSPVCNLFWLCHGCNLTEAEGTISFGLDQSLSYATSIVWNFTTSAGVPVNQISTFESAIQSDPGRSFRGPEPSNVNLQMTRTLFDDRTGSEEAGSGYQIEFLTNRTGSQVTAALFGYARSLGFQFTLKRSETTFAIERESILTTATFIASLLGGVSGVLAGIGALLGIAEGVQLYFAKKRAMDYTNELGRKRMPEDLPLDGKTFEKYDWVIASLFAPIAARLEKWEAEAKYVAPKPVPPPPPREFAAWEWFLVLGMEFATYSLPLRVFSSITDDAVPNQETFATTILLDWGRAVFFMWISSRLTGNAGFLQHYFKFDKLTARALMFAITYIGMLLPDGASAGQSIAIISEAFFNLTLMGHTRVMQKFHVWTEHTLFLYKIVRLYAPILFACASGSYVVTASDGKTRDLVLLWMLFGIEFYNEAFVHVSAFVITKHKKKPDPNAKPKAVAATPAAAAAAGGDATTPGAAALLAADPNAPSRDQMRHQRSSLDMAAGDRISFSTTEAEHKATIAASSGDTPMSAVTLAKLHAGRHSRSHSASSKSTPELKVSVSDHVPHTPDHSDLPTNDLGIALPIFVLAIVVEILSSFAPIGKLYDDSQSQSHASTTNSTSLDVGLSNPWSVLASGLTTTTTESSGTGEVGSSAGYERGVIATVVLTWARSIFWMILSLHVVRWDRMTYIRYVTTLDFLTGRTFIMQIAYTVNLFAVNTTDVAWVSCVSDWVMAFVFTAYIRIMFKCLKWHDPTLLRVYKAQRFIAPIVCLSVGITILTFPLYDEQPEAYILYLACAVLFYFDIIIRYWHVPALNDTDPPAHGRGGHTLVQPRASSSASPKAGTPIPPFKPSFDPRDTRPKTSLMTRPLAGWVFTVSVIIEILSSSSPIFRLVAKSSSEDDGNAEAQRNSLATTVALCWARTLFWLYCSERQRLAAMWNDYFVLDNLLLGTILQSIAYGALSVKAYTDVGGGWVPAVIASDFIMNICLAGHIRVLCKYYVFAYTDLYVYRLQRLYAPCLWILVGVMYTWKSSDESTKADFVLYLVCGVQFFFDLYSRITKIKDVLPITDEDREIERVRKFQIVKEQRETAARLLAEATARKKERMAAVAAAAVAAEAAGVPVTTSAPLDSIAVVELPSLAPPPAAAAAKPVATKPAADAAAAPAGATVARSPRALPALAMLVPLHMRPIPATNLITTTPLPPTPAAAAAAAAAATPVAATPVAATPTAATPLPSVTPSAVSLLAPPANVNLYRLDGSSSPRSSSTP